MNLFAKLTIRIAHTLLVFGLIIVMSIIITPPLLLAQDGGISNLIYDPDDDFDIEDEWDEYEDYTINDPYENYNRKMFNINDKIYRYVFSPLAIGYDFLFPKRIQRSLNNVFKFSGTPKRFFNNLFQKKYKSSFIEFERLLINASLGIGGLFDPADHFFHLELLFY